MARLPRLFLTGFPHHIVQRGHNRKAVFHEQRDFQIYLGNLAEQAEELEIDILAFCLMTNHVHLLLQPQRAGGDLSKLMRVLAARQTRHVNRVLNRSGTLWEGRFKCSLVDSDKYLLACCVYIDANPLRAGLVDDACSYPWSSCHMRDLAQRTSIRVSLPHCYLMLGGNPNQRRAQYLEYLSGGLSDHTTEAIRQGLRSNQLTGTLEFRQTVEARVERTLVHRLRGRPPKC